jgi:spoIIIJ-associated protein
VVRPASAIPAFDEKSLAAAQKAQEFLTGLLAQMGLRATVEIVAQSDAEADEQGDTVPVLNIVGGDLEVLIGRQNETVSAMEFITRLAVNQQSHIRSTFIVDVNGYRARRAESLRKLGLRTAEQVIQTNRTMALEPMSPSERRIIHLALRDHPKVFTQSVGEGDRRKVTVVPKKD